MHMINFNWEPGGTEGRFDMCHPTISKYTFTCCNRHLHTPSLQKYPRSTSINQFIEVSQRISKSAGKRTLLPPTRHSWCPSKPRRKTRIANILCQKSNSSNSLYQNQILIWRALRNIDEIDTKSINTAPNCKSGRQTRKLELISVYYNTGRYRKPTIPAAIFTNILTHIQLTNEACKVVVLEILRKDFACKRRLIVDQESGSILRE